ncbi:MAG: hypothetical protein A2007_04970 [Verrucomicrobia bacterium GWC2_42_7]|nr:MAG: hypothetical protein A2007_04970 [Verrucomicrobia bacterium GWC2_42_7]
MSDFILEAIDLYKSYKTPVGSLPILQRINLQVSPGEFVSITGESGSGKTTLLYALTLLENPDSGKLLWDSVSTSELSKNAQTKFRAKFLSIIFQSYHLFPELNIFENVLMAKRILGPLEKSDKEDALHLLDQVGLSHRLTHLPSQLSGGECQRVAIARALLNKPKVIFADEPTGNLDEKTAQQVFELITQICSTHKITLVLVTHNLKFASLAQRSYILRDNQLH